MISLELVGESLGNRFWGFFVGGYEVLVECNENDFLSSFRVASGVLRHPKGTTKTSIPVNKVGSCGMIVSLLLSSFRSSDEISTSARFVNN